RRFHTSRTSATLRSATAPTSARGRSPPTTTGGRSTGPRSGRTLGSRPTPSSSRRSRSATRRTRAPAPWSPGTFPRVRWRRASRRKSPKAGSTSAMLSGTSGGNGGGGGDGGGDQEEADALRRPGQRTAEQGDRRAPQGPPGRGHPVDLRQRRDLLPVRREHPR